MQKRGSDLYSRIEWQKSKAVVVMCKSLDTFGEVKLDEANGERDLGVSIDDDLKFSSHAQGRWTNATGF
ncbi:unnamed protein product [Darwinula stevensoni]|uniref:Uncharacterized protein n=1 Tax=Darwinula stevensoni TaxID=69355 RepID=A0A7R9AE08_9CRUS|nr:unnamed protein product [Darwinula stevensoni]CAG0901543.1 unnamed protein product [Darwinula stevensoni]